MIPFQLSYYFFSNNVFILLINLINDDFFNFTHECYNALRGDERV